MILAHVSDTHLGERPQNAARLRQLAYHLRARLTSGEEIALALTGDLTHDGQVAEWHALLDALDPVIGHMPIFAVPGNHDVGSLGITYDPQRALQARVGLKDLCEPWARKVGALRVWMWGGCKIIGLDSCVGNADDLLPPLARGEIGAAQLASLESELADAVPTIILLHHHPLWSEWAHALEDADQLLALLDRRAHVTHVLYGHKHREECATRGQQGAHKTLYLGAGKATESEDGRLRYRTLDLETGHVQVVTCPAPAGP